MNQSLSKPPSLLEVRDELARRHLADFVEATVTFKLHEWQRKHLCPILERFRTERGIRLLIHGPPQYGKSIIMTKRLPAWLLGDDPLRRIVIAAYNETHATKQMAEPVRNIMHAPDYRRMFPGTRIPPVCTAQEFSTLERAALNDGQASITAVGLQSGFTGKGLVDGDTLLVDDPYASPDEANSPTTNDTVWRWANEVADSRCEAGANVAWMFHRYHDMDVIGRLIAQGGWELVRFPAIADENEDNSDPTGREIGEVLSPKHSVEHLQEIERKAPKVFLSQFQGKPRPDSGNFIHEAYLIRHEGPTPRLVRWIRYWDLAVSKKQTADYTTGALVGIAEDNTVYLRHMVRERLEWPDVADLIIKTAEDDYQRAKEEQWDYQIGVDARIAQIGFFQDLIRKGGAILGRIPIWPDRDAQQDKKSRASGWVARAKADKFRWIKGDWNFDEFKQEAMAFDGKELSHDDQVDAVSGAYALLWELNGGKEQEDKPLDNNSIEYFERLEALSRGD